MRPVHDKPPVVVYRCEWCNLTYSRAVTGQGEGLCPLCNSPMRIDDLFSDRRAAQLPVPLERRAA